MKYRMRQKDDGYVLTILPSVPMGHYRDALIEFWQALQAKDAAIERLRSEREELLAAIRNAVSCMSTPKFSPGAGDA